MNRRKWIEAGGAAALGALSAPCARAFSRPEAKLDCVFQLSVITDEISQDFAHAVEVAAKEFGVGFVELRGLWNKNIVNLDAKEVAEVQSLLKKHELKVTDIASPLFKVDWPGAPKSKYSPKGDAYNASFSFEQQDEVLERACQHGTRIRHRPHPPVRLLEARGRQAFSQGHGRKVARDFRESRQTEHDPGS
jgi:hypothetical protein